MMHVKYFELVLYTIFIAIIWFGVGYTFGCDYKSRSFKNEAVVQGMAEYIPNENGSPVWQWKKQ